MLTPFSLSKLYYILFSFSCSLCIDSLKISIIAVVQWMDSAFNRINPADTCWQSILRLAINWIVIYSVDSDIQRPFEQPGANRSDAGNFFQRKIE